MVAGTGQPFAGPYWPLMWPRERSGEPANFSASG